MGRRQRPGSAPLQAHPHRSTGNVPLALSADGRTLVSCVGNEPVRVWDVSTSKEVGPLKEPPPAAVLLALDRAGKKLAVFGRDGSLGLWDLRSGKAIPYAR